MNLDQARHLLAAGARVRVWNTQHTAVLAQGEVIALAPSPTITVREPSGQLRDWLIDLPIDVLNPDRIEETHP